MVLNKQRQYLILCEDKQQQYFIRHFLMECNINRSKISCEPLPKSGSGEQYVRENYVKVLKKCRSRNRAVTVVLAIDADVHTVVERMNQLDNMCQNTNTAKRSEADPLMMLISKRNIESWIKYFSSENANETDVYSHLQNISDAKPAVVRFSDDITNGRLSVSDFVSLRHAQEEYDRICRVV